jgi:hypothetical protein
MSTTLPSGLPLDKAIESVAYHIVRSKYFYSIGALCNGARVSGIKGFQAGYPQQETQVLALIYPEVTPAQLAFALQAQVAHVATCLNNNWDEAAKARFGADTSTYRIPVTPRQITLN